MATRFRIAIVGAGPSGIAAGVQAARRGVSHVLLERSVLADTIVKYQKGKHVMDEPPQLPLRRELEIPFEAGSREAVLEGWRRAVDEAGVHLRAGPGFEVTALAGRAGDFALTLKDGSTIHAEAVVLTIGLQGDIRTFGVPGENLPHVGYQLDDPAEHVDRDVVVVGAGDAAIENALALAEKNEVSIVNRQEEFARARPANRRAIEAAIKSGKVRLYANATVNRIDERAIWLDSRDGEVRIKASLVIGRLGAEPPRAFLEAMGIRFRSADRGALPEVSSSYETNVPGIHLIGAAAGYPLIKHCINQGHEVVEGILGHPVEPADEPLLREVFAGLPGTVSEILESVRETLPLFAGLTTIQLREFLVDSTVQRPPEGEVIFRRNDFSDSFYAILGGTVEVVAPGSESDRAGVPERRFTLARGQYFGEMSLVSGRRRSATVLAGADCVLIETPRLSMQKLLRSVPSVQRTIDETFVLRRLQTTFDLPLVELQALAHESVIATYRAGDFLFEEGDPPDGLHLIRRGSVTVLRRAQGREQVLSYLPAGHVIGEMALLSQQARRTASVRATVLTETIRLPTEAIQRTIRAHPSLRRSLEQLEEERLVENVRRGADTRAGDLISFLMDAGAGEATDILLIDEARCVRCDNCETACAETHGGVSRLDREAGPSFGTVHVPTSCRHCENPRCMTDCPPDALRRHPTGEVFILDSCIGCGRCAANCPYNVIQMAAVEELPRRSPLLQLLFGGGRFRQPSGDGHKKAVKCDLCRELPGSGAGRTACVSSCPTGAILRVNPKRYVDDLMVIRE